MIKNQRHFDELFDILEFLSHMSDSPKRIVAKYGEENVYTSKLMRKVMGMTEYTYSTIV